MTCKTSNEVLGCYTNEDGVSQTVVVHNVVDVDGVVFATLFLDEKHKEVEGATSDNVTLGACPVNKNSECWNRLFYEAGVDNSFTSFRDTNATITAVFDDGCPDASFDIPDNTGGWTAQINAISEGIASILPDSLQNSSYCTIPNTDPPEGCVGLPTPEIFLPDMKWRYAGFRVCPGDKAPIKFIYNSDQRKDVLLDYNIKSSELTYYDRCFDCETGEVTWFNCATGEEVPEEDLVDGKPVCSIPCSQSFPEPPTEVPCQSGVLTGCVFDADGVQQVGGVTEIYKFCEGFDQPQLQLLTDYGQDTQEEVILEPGWYFGDCATGEPIEPPIEPFCDPETDWHVMNGFICDEGDERFGDPVCWVQGVDVCGQTIFPDGAKCPVYLPGKFDTRVSAAGECQSTSLANAVTGVAQAAYGSGGAGTSTHSIKFAQTSGSGLAGLANVLEADIANQNFTVCRITMNGEVVFTYDPRTLTRTGGTPGDGQSIAYESTLQNDIQGCEADYQSLWDTQVNDGDSSAGYTRNCTTLSFVAAGSPMDADCTVPMDPQPTQVSKSEPKVEAGPCDDFEIVELFTMNPDSLTGTLRNREWDLGPRQSSNKTVAEGKAQREAFDFAAATTVDADWTNLAVNDTNNDNTIEDAQVIEGYILVDQDIKLRWGSGSLGYFALELGKCCGPLELMLEGASGDGSANPTLDVLIPKGAHAIRMWNIDDYTNTSRNVQYSLDDGQTWTTNNTPPGIQMSRQKPDEACKKVKVCKPSGDFLDLYTDALLLKADFYDCSKLCTPICCGGSSEVEPVALPLTARITELS